MTDLSHLPPNRKRTEEECQATVMLLNGSGGEVPDGEVGGWWYGSNAHMIMHNIEEWDYDNQEETYRREYFDADTMKPITKKNMADRIKAYNNWMADTIDDRTNRMKLWAP